MNAIQLIRQWCTDHGHSFCYGNPYHVEEWMGNTDFSQSADETAVYAYLLTSSRYVDQHDTYDVGVFFARLIPFDFDNQSIDTLTEDLKELSKGLLAYIHAGNLFGWSDARWQYGYDDYAENVAWCCLRVTMTALSADCTPIPEPPVSEYVSVPQAAAEYIALLGYTPTIHGDYAAVSAPDGEGTYNIVIAAFLVSPESAMLSLTATVNGYEIPSDVVPTLIGEGLTDIVPSLTPYIGQYLYILDASTGEGYPLPINICVTMEAGDGQGGGWSGDEQCWEEVP